jgi:hypothetical protein
MTVAVTSRVEIRSSAPTSIWASGCATTVWNQAGLLPRPRAPSGWKNSWLSMSGQAPRICQSHTSVTGRGSLRMSATGSGPGCGVVGGQGAKEGCAGHGVLANCWMIMAGRPGRPGRDEVGAQAVALAAATVGYSVSRSVLAVICSGRSTAWWSATRARRTSWLSALVRIVRSAAMPRAAKNCTPRRSAMSVRQLGCRRALSSPPSRVARCSGRPRRWRPRASHRGDESTSSTGAGWTRRRTGWLGRSRHGCGWRPWPPLPWA